jgi:hypothetical protein
VVTALLILKVAAEGTGRGPIGNAASMASQVVAGGGGPSRASRLETAGGGTPGLSAARIRSNQGAIWRASPSGAKALA